MRSTRNRILDLHTKFQLNWTKDSINLYYLVFEAVGSLEVKREVTTNFDLRHEHKISAPSDHSFLRYYFLLCHQN